MTCYNPIVAYQTKIGAPLRFKTPHGAFTVLQLPCNRCIGCRLDQAKLWRTRILHEASLYEKNIFLTLTYDAAHLPSDNKLKHRDFQLFMKRLRKSVDGNIRYFMCGEYGEKLKRPHYHAILFNYSPDDLKPVAVSRHGHLVNSSPKLSKLWGNGFIYIGCVTKESAGYVARYLIKGEKILKKDDGYIAMSRRPGIAAAWVEKYITDMYKGFIFDGEIKQPLPKFYMERLRENNLEIYEKVLDMRKKAAILKQCSDGPSLESQEQVKKAAIRNLKRS